MSELITASLRQERHHKLHSALVEMTTYYDSTHSELSAGLSVIEMLFASCSFKFSFDDEDNLMLINRLDELVADYIREFGVEWKMRHTQGMLSATTVATLFAWSKGRCALSSAVDELDLIVGDV